MNNLLKTLFIFLTLVACSQSNQSEIKKNNPPNIIYILADDLGYGDIGILGQKKFETPNLDRLAKGGMIFTQHYSGSTVCAPSRSALMLVSTLVTLLFAVTQKWDILLKMRVNILY